MKNLFSASRVLLAGTAILLTTSIASARTYGVSSHSAGRGTVYNTSRGGSAYVGPRGAAAQGANGRAAATGRYGSVYSGPNATAVSGHHYYGSTTSVGHYSSTSVTHYGSTTVSGGYLRTVPVGARPVVYGGYHCYVAGGVYYRPVFYGGTTVYVVVN
ncbi:MAG TPA: hypothetical protein VNB29_06725 [Chthoniobacterales bacterium]|nr:hypothetical protein [Chthoniobacterales bacterium]